LVLRAKVADRKQMPWLARLAQVRNVTGDDVRILWSLGDLFCKEH